MTGKKQVTPDEARTTDAAPIEAPAKRQATGSTKAAGSPPKGQAKKVGMGGHADRQKNAFGIKASASKATAVSRAIISRARGGRKR